MAEIPKGVFSFGAAGVVRPEPLADPNVDGVSCGDAWYLLEPTQGVFDWSRLDANVNAIASAGKHVLIRIGTGSGGQSQGGNKPDWLMALVGANTFTFLDGDAGEVTIPVFWYQPYLDAKKAMIQAVGDRYAGNPAVKVFACNFANANSEDWGVPTGDIVDGVAPPGSTMTSRWVTAGYTHAKMVDAGKQIIDTAMVAFPNQVIYMSIGAGKVPSLTLEPEGPLALPIEVLEAARAQWGERFVPAHNSFNGRRGATQMEIDHPPSAGQNTWFVFGDTTFRMMPGGNPDNLTADQILRLVFDLATATGDVRFLEVYEKDVINLSPAIAYGHFLLNPTGGIPPPPPIPPPPGGIEEIPLAYRSLKFRDVVWGIANKMGWISDWNPTKGPSDDQFAELVSFINAWIRRIWDMEDWPEWTRISEVKPDTNHFVPLPGRVLRMFLVDPRITPGLVEDAPFGMFESRIHCGFEHGTSVWLKYIQPPPVFAHEKWDDNTTYSLGDIRYSPTTGECYKSIQDANRGNDPALQGIVGGRIELDVEVTQEFVRGVEAEPAASEIWEVSIGSVADNSVFRFLFTADDGAHEFEYIFPGGMTPDQMLDDIVAKLDVAADPFIAGITYLALHAQDRIRMTLATARFSLRVTLDETPGGPPPAIDLPLQNTSDYNPGRVGQTEVPQIAVMTIDSTLNLKSALYQIRARDREGGVHQVGYLSETDEDLQVTLQGIISAISVAVEGDPFWGEVVVIADPDENTLEFTTAQTVDYDGSATIQGNRSLEPAWEQVVFPQAIAEPVMRGAYSDALREEGQTDKAGVEEQATVPELAVASGKSTNQPFDRLTQQQGPRSRYRS